MRITGIRCLSDAVSDDWIPLPIGRGLNDLVSALNLIIVKSSYVLFDKRMYKPTIVTKIHIKFIAVFSGSHVTANNAKIMTHNSGTKPRRMKRICSFNQSLMLFIIVHF
jgi:hypothetical protein